MKKIIYSSIICLVFLLANSRVNAQCSNSGNSATCLSYSPTYTDSNWAYWYVTPYSSFSVSAYVVAYGSTGYAYAFAYADGNTADWYASPSDTPVSGDVYLQGGDAGYLELITYVDHGRATVTAYW